MKKNILSISIIPLICLMAFSFTGGQPQKENNKGNKNNNAETKGNPSQGNNGNSNTDKAHGNNKGSQSNGQGKDKSDQPKHWKDDGDNQNGKSTGHSKANKSNGKNSMSKNDNGNGNDRGKSPREAIKWDRDENINWGFENYSNRKWPKDFKKVSVCHNTGNSNAPVTINVSENALKAHLNHGDQVGNCTGNYSNRWPADFIRTRENVYNSYENTWETMSYSEALLRFAADKLLGIKSTFQTQRPTLTSQEAERRQLLIMDLQNNVTSLENQLAVSKQRMGGVNINITL